MDHERTMKYRIGRTTIGMLRTLYTVDPSGTGSRHIGYLYGVDQADGVHRNFLPLVTEMVVYNGESVVRRNWVNAMANIT
ncbi:hypothetical protein DTO207G8_3780 [Paecilomyces variotii]|nr:hypothetical protein DTO207G8_3780 [Paecilomyces variotii]KAJ9264799.1 hypothetical protein DTO195F2_2250 [Paecilomyces variotii]